MKKMATIKKKKGKTGARNRPSSDTRSISERRKKHKKTGTKKRISTGINVEKPKAVDRRTNVERDKKKNGPERGEQFYVRKMIIRNGKKKEGEFG